jgi:hypothetical protein
MNERDTRRAIIREWMALPRDKRETAEHTAKFAEKAVQRHTLPPSNRAPYQVVTGWLLPRTGKP